MIHAYRKKLNNNGFYVFRIELKEDETQYSFFSDKQSQVEAEIMVHNETEGGGLGPVLFLIQKGK